MRTGIGRVAALAAIALGVWAPAGQAAPGDFDESFGAGGKKTYDFGGPDGAFGLRIQADGKLVLGGYAGVRPNLAAFRLLPAGLPDTSFSADGLASFAFNVETRARALALQPDGKIVLAGQTVVAGDDIAIGRLNTDGTPDGTFSDATGKRTLNLFGSDSAAAVLVQPDGGIIVAGHGGANSN